MLVSIYLRGSNNTIITGTENIETKLNAQDLSEILNSLIFLDATCDMEDITDLQRPPFDKPVSFIKLFDAKTRSALMRTIQSVKDNAVNIVA